MLGAGGRGKVGAVGQSDRGSANALSFSTETCSVESTVSPDLQIFKMRTFTDTNGPRIKNIRRCEQIVELALMSALVSSLRAITYVLVVVLYHHFKVTVKELAHRSFH